MSWFGKRKDVALIDQAYEKAIEVVTQCATKQGLYASGGFNGYKGVWSRDSNITLIGASTDDNPLFKEQWRKSLEMLKTHQSDMGQIPNAVLNFDKSPPQVDFKSIDSSLWFVLGHHLYVKRYGDGVLFKKHHHAIKKAIRWLHYRDVGEDVTLEQLPTTDWQDAFPHKYGVTINTQALYYGMLSLVGDKKRKEKLSRAVNETRDTKLWNSEFYWAYRWKNHNKYKEIGDWFDALGNVLAILFDLADRSRALTILRYIKRHHLAEPFPMKCIAPTIKPGGAYWEDYYYDAKATPNHYLNGGIWPFIGGLYVVALVKMKKYSDAEAELERLAKGNLFGQLFPEWIDPITEKTYGRLQAWSAGTYIWAYNAVKTKKTFL